METAYTYIAIANTKSFKIDLIVWKHVFEIINILDDIV